MGGRKYGLSCVRSKGKGDDAPSFNSFHALSPDHDLTMLYTRHTLVVALTTFSFWLSGSVAHEEHEKRMGIPSVSPNNLS